MANQVLSMDAMTDESDPAMAIGFARLHLDEARGLAVDLHKHLNAARNATAHLISEGVNDGQESMPWDRGPDRTPLSIREISSSRVIAPAGRPSFGD